MTFKSSQHQVHEAMSTAEATRYAKMLVERESRGYGDIDGALNRIEQKYGLSRWQVDHLRSGRAKSCDVGLFARIRGAYISLCEGQLRSLEHEIAIERAKGGGDAALDDIEAATSAARKALEARKAG